MLHWITRFLWKRLDLNKPPNGVVLVTWARASGISKVRVAVWEEARSYGGDSFGRGFSCYCTGRPLTDQMTHWMPQPKPPSNAGIHRAAEGRPVE
jgi:hypothetical protein